MNRTRIILTGGFLGAGKTTLIWHVAKRLIQQGSRVGLITNDQAPELVDSQILRQAHFQVAEVAGSCFCCNFNGFADAISNVRKEAQADFILAEPVGSCADLSATIMQPLKKYWNTELIVSPLTVLAEPSRLSDILKGQQGGLHEDAAYIYRKQLEEADIILITKTDTLTPDSLNQLMHDTEQTFPHAMVMTVCALEETGIDAWLNEVMTRTEAGTRLLDIDYDRYAHGEAVLGWLNATVNLHGTSTAWDLVVNELMTDIKARIDAESLRVGHVKVIAENGQQYAVGNITGADNTLTLRNGAGESTDVRLIINARVECTPEHLDEMIRQSLGSLSPSRFTEEVVAWRFLQPGRPQPTYHFTEVARV